VPERRRHFDISLVKECEVQLGGVNKQQAVPDHWMPPLHNTNGDDQWLVREPNLAVKNGCRNFFWHPQISG